MWKMGAGSSVHPDCIITSFGLPQGDPASPMVMNLMMLAMKKTIDAKLQEEDGCFLHAIYMDDRTIVADNPNIVEKTKDYWNVIPDH